jgi:hypothetical protein
MTQIFTACALFGGTMLICQTLLTLIGLGGDHEMGGDHDVGGDVGHGFAHDAGSETAGEHGHTHAHHSSTWFFGIITFRTVVAALTFFGLAGMSAQSNDIAEGPSLVIGLMAGFAAMYAVHWMMRQLARLRADGSVRIEGAVGMTGKVYLRVPGSHQGAGKIHLNLQNRTVELNALTEQSELPTGAPVVVSRIVGPDTVEVVAASAG